MFLPCRCPVWREELFVHKVASHADSALLEHSSSNFNSLGQNEPIYHVLFTIFVIPVHKYPEIKIWSVKLVHLYLVRCKWNWKVVDHITTVVKETGQIWCRYAECRHAQNFGLNQTNLFCFRATLLLRNLFWGFFLEK